MKNVENLPAHELVVSPEIFGDLRVVDNLNLKKELLLRGDDSHKQIRPVLVMGGGAQAGVISGGLGIGLERAGFSDVFDYIIGISTGACGGMYILSHQAPLGTSAYYKENVDYKLVNLKRPKKILDIDLLEDIMRNRKPVNIDRFHLARNELIVGVTDLANGVGEFLSTKHVEDPIGVVIASCCVPVIAGGKFVEINGRRFVDGSVGDQPIPVRYAIEELGATDVMVWINGPLERKTKAADWIYKGIARASAIKNYSKGMREAIESYVAKYNRDLGFLLDLISGEEVVEEGVRVAAIAAPNSKVKWNTLDANLLKSAAEEGAEFMKNLLLNKR